jgi:hypothetical protein
MNAVANETVTIVAFEFTGYAYRAKGDDGVIYGTGRTVAAALKGARRTLSDLDYGFAVADEVAIVSPE